MIAAWALHLDGSSYVELPNINNLKMGISDYSICFYFKLDDLNNNYHFLRSGCTGDGFLIRILD
ncbi:MAG TPA: hypothetical protein DC049_03450 [Spirochaetia bacterium]|nr:hypothetical protein [Spirochaetia bacterium]